MDGWRVLDRLKNDLTTRHIPVCAISTDESRERALNSGALYFVAKPLQTRAVLDQLLAELDEFLRQARRQVLIVDANSERRQRLTEYLSDDNLHVTGVADAAAAFSVIRDSHVDCLVTGADNLPLDTTALAEAIGQRPLGTAIPIVLFDDAEDYTGRPNPWKSLDELAVVRRAHSPERLLDHANRFLHLPLTRIPDQKRVILEELHQSNKSLAGKKVFIVDDDMRNIFALSTVLEEHQMVISSAINGRDAIQMLRNEPNMDVVLMDIMMPDMDGFETMREIRKIPSLRGLPIIAVTAKAMKGDRERCIEAGAWDYLSKPVDPEQMLAVLRAWLHR